MSAEIHTKRLLIRPYQEDDAASLHQLISENKEYLRPSFPNLLKRNTTLDGSKSFIEWCIENRAAKQLFPAGIWEPEHALQIGHIFLREVDWKVPKCEVGYLMAKGKSGQGLMTEALLAYTDWAFSALAMEKIFLRVIVGNTSSERVAQKCGFKREGLLRNDFRVSESKLADVIYYGKLKSEAE